MEHFKKTVYLAGAISYFLKTDQEKRACLWRENAEKFFENYGYVKCFNPCKMPNEAWEYPTDGIIKQNYYYLTNSDIVLVNLDAINTSIGTIWELSTAWNAHKLIVAFGKEEITNPHLKSMIDMQFDNLDDALYYIGDMFSY